MQTRFLTKADKEDLQQRIYVSFVHKKIMIFYDKVKTRFKTMMDFDEFNKIFGFCIL